MDFALKVIGYPLPRFSLLQDTRIWKFSTDGIFTTRSAYQALIIDEVDTVGGDWKWLCQPVQLTSRWLAALHLASTEGKVTHK